MYKQSRRSGAKVKTGCKTCKIRRVKCDENRPNCLRCTSTGRSCDGYTSPKRNFQVQIWSQSSPQKTIPVLSRFGDSIRYLEFYHHCVRPMLSSNFDADFWSRITLQMAYSEPAVRHALIALSYLHSTETGSIKHARSRFAGQHESGILLYHYNKSVRSLVDRIGETHYKPEIGLVTCLVFVCMEFLRGNYHTAFIHLTNGLKIIFEYQKQTRNDSSVLLPSKMWGTSTAVSKFPLSYIVEETLKPIFVRAMASALMYGFGADVTNYFHTPSLPHYKQLQFENIREAQLTAYELRNQSIRYIQIITRRLFYSQKEPFTPEEVSRQLCMLGCQHAWYEALERFRHRSDLSAADELAVSALLTHHHAINIWTACAIELREMAFDGHLETFKVILNHARIILDSMNLDASQPAARFTFEISIIPALYFVATRCRCPTTRREAVTLLARNPPREGMWDAKQHAVVAIRVIEIEEKEIDPTTGWPLQRARLCNSVINADMDRNGGFWVYFMPVSWLDQVTPDGKPKVFQEFFVLDDNPTELCPLPLLP